MNCRIVSIHQPNYFPWLGLFDKIMAADFFVFLDDVQYSNNQRHNRNTIKTSNGWSYLTVPVNQHLGDTIHEVTTKDQLRWKEKHLKTIYMNYRKSYFFEAVYPDVEKWLLSEYTSLADQNISIISGIARRFGIETEFIRSSQLGIHGKKEARVIDVVKALNCDCYYSGNGARKYQITSNFEENGINLLYQKYQVEEYPQLWGGFIPNLSVIDYIMNCGYQLPQNIIKNYKEVRS